jgi:DNA (cytosine-5)-methyltransferase 1
VDPVEACRGRRVGLMWLSPDCKHFSKAKGGKPVSPRVRGLAWVAVRWAAAVKPRIIVLENVEEFQTWGPVDPETGRPCPERRGRTFRSFLAKLRRLGYVVEWRELRACDYGAPTIRKRLFLVARCDGQPIVWPAPTHGKGRAQPWRTAAECIDFSLPCPSIFTRKKALAENTLKRIGAGLRRFVFEADRPFIVPVTHHGDSRSHSVGEPFRTITGAHRGEMALVEPLIVGVGGRMGQSAPRSVHQPYQTITAKGDAAVVEPFLVEYHGPKRDGDDRTADLDAPLPVQDTSNRFGLVEPFLVPMQHQNRATSPEEPLQTVTTQGNKFNLVSPVLVPIDNASNGAGGAASAEDPLSTITAEARHVLVAPILVPRYGEDPDPRRNGGEGQAPRAQSVEKPLSTIVPTGNGASLVAGFLAKHYGDRGQRPGLSLFEPAATVTPCDHHALVTSTLVNLRGTADSQLVGRSIEEPLPTISGGGIHAAEVRAFLVTYYGTDQRTGNLFDPMVTVTPKDRLGLVMVEGVEYQLADIGMRMLAPRELYRAQGFPDSYKIDIEFNGKPMSKTAQVRMCGNSVCPDVAAAVIRANVRRADAGECAA